jgi:hypothetical protein
MEKISFTKNPAQASRIASMFLSETCFGMEFREFACFFLHGTEFRVFFSFAERSRTEFREFSVLLNGSERNSKSLLLFLFHGTEFRAFFSSEERFGTEFRELSVPRNSRNSAGTNQLSIYSVFRELIFLSEIVNPSTNRVLWN